MGKTLIRVSSFLTKEIREVLRQPRLILALLLGPFLILLLFGLGYRAAAPRLRGILVVPDAIRQQVDLNALQAAASQTFQDVEVTNDAAQAMAKLNARQAEVVEIIPEDASQRIQNGEQVMVEFHYAEIDPVNETWIQSLGYSQVNEMNKALLMQTASRLQQEARSNSGWVSQTRRELDSLDASAGEAELQQKQQSIRRLRALVGTMIASPLLARAAAPDENPEQVKQDLNDFANDLDALDAAITNKTFSQQSSRISTARQHAANLDTLLARFAEIPTQVLVSPLQPAYMNAQGQALSLTTFYAPAVLALILQHIAITLGALSLVRERLLGSIEMFRVAPVSTREVLIGKYLAYAFFLALMGGALALAMFALQVPFRGDPASFGALLFILVLASLGIGLLISIVSKSETQAVQLSMLMLLLSVFFGGFFLPLENFWLPVRVISFMLPLTPGILGLQDIMLRGLAPALWIWLLLGGIALFTFVLVNLFAPRQLRFQQG